MASTREEVKIRLGVDGSQVNAGLMSVRQKINKFADDAQRKLGSIFKANVFMAATSLLQSLIPSAQEFWDAVYGTDEAGMEKMRKANENIRKIREEFENARKGLEDVKETAEYEDADSIGKAEILRKRKAEKDKEISDSEARLAEIKRKRDFAKTVPEERQRLTLKAGEEETKLMGLRKESFEISRKLKGVTNKTSDDSIEFRFNQMLEASKKDVGTLRGRYNEQNSLATAYQRTGETDLANQAIASRDEARGQIGEIIKARSVQGLGNVADRLPNIDMFEEMRQSLLMAQLEAMKTVVQKVSIVDVKDPK